MPVTIEIKITGSGEDAMAAMNDCRAAMSEMLLSARRTPIAEQVAAIRSAASAVDMASTAKTSEPEPEETAPKKRGRPPKEADPEADEKAQKERLARLIDELAGIAREDATKLKEISEWRNQQGLSLLREAGVGHIKELEALHARLK